MIDSDKESECETHSAGECSFASTEEWMEDNISWKLEDFTGMSDVTTDCNNPSSVSDATISGQPAHQAQALVSAELPWSVMS